LEDEELALVFRTT